MVGSGRSHRGCENAYRPVQAAAWDDAAIGRMANLAVARGTMVTAMPRCESGPTLQPSPQAMSDCPDCRAELAVLRIIPGRAGAEYWTMRCVKCGGIHLNIVKASSPI
jgi:hypothetical protein